jgi:hypothetical protein
MNSRLNIVNEFIGSTLRTTWVNSGATPSTISSALYNNSTVLVSSISQTSSGNGHYYADLALPNSKQWMLNEQIAVIDGRTLKRFQLVHVQQPRIGL